ncbi:serine hydrolase domain-containing protein [Niabella beijingensis]|uniref:serine hydrolase domain-containing protein n=1 Tax=Niabella beijingensis TaxID=2872700 RepID=UPI001CC0554C|nr:serine hydrolase domain-containing protein [Niabella beijingensis]MBZ4189445.1 beta-lactamase family protein [Niabella beijingensis]
MKTKKATIALKQMLGAALSLTIAAGMTSCHKTDLPIEIPGKVFKTALFKKNLEEKLKDARGYQFLIMQNKQVAEKAAFGVGSTPGAGNLSANVDAYVNIASITKTLTAITTIKLLEKRKLGINTKIGMWLPKSWAQHDDIRNLTFKQLLTHTSGIRGSNTSWDSLKQVVGSPINAPQTPASYSNINFALFRAMLPKINNPVAFGNWELALSPKDFDSWMSKQYIALVQEYVFDKAGLGTRNCKPVEGKTLQMLNQAPARLEGRSHGDWTELCGGGGFVLTTTDLARIIVFLTHTEQLLSKQQKQMMDTERLGWNGVFAVTGGTAYGHGGALYSDRNGVKGPQIGDLGLETIIVKLPAQVELALTINSVGDGWRNMYGLVKEAYNASWVEE